MTFFLLNINSIWPTLFFSKMQPDTKSNFEIAVYVYFMFLAVKSHMNLTNIVKIKSD